VNKGVFPLRKAITAVGVLCLAGGLAACGNYEGALDARYDDRARPIGYYANENERNNNRAEENGNVYMMNDNDGPVTEFLERGVTDQGAVDRRTDVNRREIVNPTVPFAEQDRNIFMRDDRFSRADFNYHGHVYTPDRKTRSSYYNKYDGKLAEKIAARAANVENVKDARALVYRDSILVALDTNAKNSTRAEHLVKQAISPYTKNKKVRVVSNQSMYNRVCVIDNRLRTGGPFEEVERDFRTIFNNGEIIERPLNVR
jgi:spore cortex protein